MVPNLQPRKMNRSFHKSQPLRSADCNAVEVKSKVGAKEIPTRLNTRSPEFHMSRSRAGTAPIAFPAANPHFYLRVLNQFPPVVLWISSKLIRNIGLISAVLGGVGGLNTFENCAVWSKRVFKGEWVVSVWGV